MPTKYKVDEKYFSVIDDEHKAYWLGFIYADGYLNKKRNIFGIEIKESDAAHLEKFNQDIKSDRPIKIYNKNSTFGPQINCRWICSNKMLYNDLINHGITATKSYDGIFPTIEHKEYIKDVIRGIFDGDGCITYRKGTLGYLIGSISICNTKETLEHIEEFSGFKWTWSQRHPDKDVNNYQIACGVQDNIVKFLNLIYKNASIYLDRKYQRYQEYVHSRDFAEKEGVYKHNYNKISSNNTSGVSGVSWNKSSQKWNARISIDGKPINLGYFIDFDDAVNARKNAERQYLSSFWKMGDDKIAL